MHLSRDECFLRWIGYRPLVMESLKIVLWPCSAFSGAVGLQCSSLTCRDPSALWEVLSDVTVQKEKLLKRRNEEDSD